MTWLRTDNPLWKARANGSWIELRGKHCVVTLECRPHYCDRGHYLAKVTVNPATSPADLDIDGQDGWPRYYFDEERAKLEVEAWMKRREQL